MTAPVVLARSFLFAPGDRPDRFGKAHAAGADAVILDLEDGVDPASRESARGHVHQYLTSSGRTSLVRLSDCGGAGFAADLSAIGGEGLAGVLIPKAEDPDTVGRVVRALPEDAAVILLVETATGVLAADALARLPGVTRLALGTADLEADTGIAQDPEILRGVRIGLTLASRAAGLPGPVDGVCTDLSDPSATEAAAHEAARTGFTGKLCVHPRQVPPVNAVFTPTPSAIDRSRRIVGAAHQHGSGAFRLDGQMVDAPVLKRAHAILAAAEAFAADTDARSWKE